jgi:hypothetical protein
MIGSKAPGSVLRRHAGGGVVPEALEVPSQKRLAKDVNSSARSDGSTTASEDESSPRQPAPVVHHFQTRIGDGDFASGPSNFITLSSNEWLPKFCCKIPGLILFSLMSFCLVSSLLSPTVFRVIAAILGFMTLGWTANLSISSAIGRKRLRDDCAKDWHSMLEEHQAASPADSDVLHFVILPNYKEDEEMMWRTLENLARSRLAKSSVRVVLGMEGREEGARDKAERLMERARPHFLSVCASFHPAGLPMELAGKSSNTQWAYRHLLQTYGTDLQHRDPSRVFLTVGDADTLFHPNYLSAVSLQALQMSVHERSWSFWQPPVFIMRNLFSVPGPTRVSSYATVSFELGGLANQKVGHHFCYSSYSTTLALTMHPLVDGWDRDVIAEDHHMFCKGFFAALREASAKTMEHGVPAPKPEVKLQPVFLPALSYLVDAGESNTVSGWFRSCHARFVQARRHSQGIAELSYVILQYVRLVQATGFWNLPFRAHTQVMGIAGKMGMVHIISQVHSFALINTFVYMAIEAIQWAMAGGLLALLGDVAANGASAALASQSLGGIGWTGITAIFGPVPPIAMLMGWVTYTVVLDVVEGRLTEATQVEPEGGEGPPALVPVVPDVDGSAKAEPGAKVGDLGWKARALLCVQILTDHANYAEITMFGYGFVPAILAAWSLMRRGTEFEYIVAAKPTC